MMVTKRFSNKIEKAYLKYAKNSAKALSSFSSDKKSLPFNSKSYLKTVAVIEAEGYDGFKTILEMSLRKLDDFIDDQLYGVVYIKEKMEKHNVSTDDLSAMFEIDKLEIEQVLDGKKKLNQWKKMAFFFLFHSMESRKA